MENSQHDEPLAIKNVAKDIFCIGYLKHQLAVFRTSLQRTAKQRMLRKDARFLFDFCGDDLRQTRMAVVEEIGKTIEIG